MMKIKIILLAFVIGLFCSCSTEPVSQSLQIDEELQPYINAFMEEAELRDYNIDLESEGFSAHIDVILDRGTVGQCLTYSDGSHEVVIHSNHWNNIDDLDREYLVFHELGHCLLGRSHSNESDDFGNCISIMQDGSSECDKRYNLQNREELISELFF